MQTLMACGDMTGGTDADGNPVCVIHAGTSLDTEARTVAPQPPDLTGRKSACGSCRRVANSDGTAADGGKMWRGSQPFLRLAEDYTEAATCTVCSEAATLVVDDNQYRWSHAHGDESCGTGDGATVLPAGHRLDSHYCGCRGWD